MYSWENTPFLIMVLYIGLPVALYIQRILLLSLEKQQLTRALLSDLKREECRHQNNTFWQRMRELGVFWTLQYVERFMWEIWLPGNGQFPPRRPLHLHARPESQKGKGCMDTSEKLHQRLWSLCCANLIISEVELRSDIHRLDGYEMSGGEKKFSSIWSSVIPASAHRKLGVSVWGIVAKFVWK